MRSLYGAWWIAVVLLAAGCGEPEPAAPPAPAQALAETAATPFENVARDDVDFVGDAACASCHEEQFQGYQHHGMAQSYYPLTPENAVEDFDAAPIYHEASDLYYHVYEEDGRFYQEEYRLGPNDDKTHRLVREMVHVVGSGTAARTYLTVQEDRYYELPLTWYTQEERWDFSPGYRESNGRFDRRIPDRCMACHNSYPETVPFVEGAFEEVPHGIGCERCHGPGELHVDERLVDPEGSTDGIDYTIVNPEHLALDRQLDVCQQCHLHGDVSLLRADADPFSFRPSQDLAEHVALFTNVAADEDGSIRVISHAERMKESACFIETVAQGGTMTCTTCHDPHQGFRQLGADYFNETCQTCHDPAELAANLPAPAQDEHTAEANCIACHMPKVEAEDAPHASFTDHLIRVVQDEPEAPRPLRAHAPVDLEPYFARDAEDDASARLTEGIAYVAYGRQQGDRDAFAQGADLLADVLADGAPDATVAERGQAQFLLGLARYHLGQVEQAIPALEEGLRAAPDVPERLNALAQAYETAGRAPQKTEALYRRALQLQPVLADVRVNLGRFLETQGRLSEAAAAYERAAQDDPWLAAAHYNLGTARLRQGDLQAGEASLREAVRLEPDHDQALGNLAMLYAQRGELEVARTFFRRALDAAPESAVAHANLGAFLLNNEDHAAALPLLQRAVELDPRYADAHANLALALFRSNRMEEARRHAQRAAALNPQHALARQLLAAI